MPESTPAQRRRMRWSFTAGFVGALAIMVVALSVIAWIQRGQLNETRTRLTALEVKDVAEDASQRTAEVATCYASARGRPALTVILRLVAGLAEDRTDREIVNTAIDSYIAGAPSIAECDRRARANGLDPKNFPPATPR